MRTIKFFILATVLCSISAMAASRTQVYLCEAQLPRGSATVIVEKDFSLGSKLTLNFYNKSKNQHYSGNLKVVDILATGDFMAEGDLLSYEQDPSIKIILTGLLNSNQNINLQLYAEGDRRIEFGFGNMLKCNLK